MATNFSWQCPFCGKHATITGEDYSARAIQFVETTSDGKLYFGTTLTVCPNKDCRKFSLTAYLKPWTHGAGGTINLGQKLHDWQLIPASQAKVLPDYIPAPIVSDYNEACAILNLSPKASATLARRCLQGMIRDFWKISKARLIDEISELQDKVDSDVWSAIDALRNVGNIGAHMEKDINVIIDVDPDEAKKLIALIELLVNEWYVARHDRQLKVKQVIALGAAKQAAKLP